MKPTYRLLQGQIGKSYALEISKRYGINENVINKAYHYKNEYSSNTEKMLRNLEIKLEEQQELIDEYKVRQEELNNLIKENYLVKENNNLKINKEYIYLSNSILIMLKKK